MPVIMKNPKEYLYTPATSLAQNVPAAPAGGAEQSKPQQSR
jgi:hypothetical protein